MNPVKFTLRISPHWLPSQLQAPRKPSRAAQSETTATVSRDTIGWHLLSSHHPRRARSCHHNRGLREVRWLVQDHTAGRGEDRSLSLQGIVLRWQEMKLQKEAEQWLGTKGSSGGGLSYCRQNWEWKMLSLKNFKTVRKPNNVSSKFF